MDERQALVDRPREVGSSSTRPGARNDTRSETGVDTLRLLFETHHYFDQAVVDVDEWRCGSIPALGLTWVEGHPASGRLARPDEVRAAGERVRGLVDERLKVRSDRGVARVDLTTTRKYRAAAEARAVLAGVASVDLPRCETIRRGTPVHSIAWAATNGRRKLARVYDKGLERGGEAWEAVRFEDQRRFSSSTGRPWLDVVADGDWQRQTFLRRFEGMRKAVDGVTVAGLPVLARALAEEVEYGYRSASEARKLAGSLVLFAGGLKPGRGQSTLHRWRRELRDAGYVIATDVLEPVEVDLAAELDAALEEFGS